MKKLKYYFYYCYFTILTQPQFLKLDRGVQLASDRFGLKDKDFFMPVSPILGTINYTMFIEDIAPYWWKGLRNYMMESCFEKYWSLRGIDD